MPENEFVISYLEAKKLVKETSNRTRFEQFERAIELDQTGSLYAFKKGSIAFEIKRYRTGRFIKKIWI